MIARSLKGSAVPVEFPTEAVRARFPALKRAAPFVYFDNAAGAQLPQTVLDAVASHLLDNNVQRGGRYEKSRAVDRMIASAREKVAAWLVLERFGAAFAWWKMRGDGRLHVEDLLPLLSERTRLVACTAVSHALGSLV